MADPRATENRIDENVHSPQRGYQYSSNPSIHLESTIALTKRREKNKTKSKNKYYIILGILLLAVFNIGGYVFNSKTFIVNVSGSSMIPTFHDSDFVILWKEKLRDQDIVTFRKPQQWKGGNENDKILIKRIAAKSGDQLNIDSKDIKVNGRTVYIFTPGECQNHKSYSHHLNSEEFFPLGDNAKISLDGRHQYCVFNEKNMLVPVKNILNSGKIFVKI